MRRLRVRSPSTPLYRLLLKAYYTSPSTFRRAPENFFSQINRTPAEPPCHLADFSDKILIGDASSLFRFPTMKRLTASAVAWLCCSTFGFTTEPDKAVLNFETHVRPILKAYCFECHGEGKKLKSGLDLRLKHFLVKGGKLGPALVPGKPADSSILQRVRSQEMPPGKKKLTKDEVAILERWIQQGAPTARPEPKELPLGFTISPDEASHWAFQAIRRVEPPKVNATKLVRNPIDQFLLATLEAKSLSFGPEADRLTLIRRATFDLIGLPPTPRRGRCFSERQLFGRLRKAGRSPARVAALWRTLGPALARRRRLCGLRGLHRRGSGA